MYSVIIPIYNEEKSVVDTINRVKKVMSSYEHEIICVNDNSKDGSRKILESIEGIILINNTSNKGYGASLKRGFKKAKGKYFIITDADGTYPVEDIPKLIKYKDQYDMVIGSRNGEKVSVPFAKKIAKGVLKIFARFITGEKIPDLNSGLRLFTRELAEKFYHLFPDGFSLTSTITVASLLSGYDVKFVPINYFKRVGKSSINPFHFFRFFFLLSRLAVYFRPLKFFFFPGVFLTICGVAFGAYQTIVMNNFGEAPLILIIVGMMFAGFGFLADLILRTKETF